MLNSAFSRISKDQKIVAGLILGIFILSANFAWLNPKAPYVIKTNEKIPLLWQYNGDAAVEFLSGAYFPTYFKIDKTRTNRPGYPFLVRTFGEAYGLIVLPVTHLNTLAKAMLGYVTLKLLVYFFGALALYAIVRRYFPRDIALLSLFLLFLHPFAVTFIGTFHTSELQFLTPVFLVWLWLTLGDSYSTKKNVLFSLIAGFLMITKQNYAIYLAILLYSFFIAKRYKESVLSFIVHLLPFGIWLLALKALHIPYYNNETANGLGVVFFQTLRSWNIVAILQMVVGAIGEWLTGLMSFFNLSLIAALLAFSLPSVRNALGRKELSFILIFAFMSAVQTVVSLRFNSYMTADLALVIFPLAAASLLRLFERFRIKKWLPLFLAGYLAVGLITIVGLPWVSPYNQQGITHPERVQELQAGKL